MENSDLETDANLNLWHIKKAFFLFWSIVDASSYKVFPKCSVKDQKRFIMHNPIAGIKKQRFYADFKTVEKVAKMFAQKSEISQ